MNEVIWYGVGKVLAKNEQKFIEETGIPIALCDADTAKHGQTYKLSGGGRN